MKLDSERLRAEADAHSARMQSPLWADDGGKREDNWAARLSAGAQPSVPSPSDSTKRERTAPLQPTEWESLLSADDETLRLTSSARPPTPEPAAEGILPRLDALDQTVAKLFSLVSRRAAGGAEVPGWLATAAGVRIPTMHRTPSAGACAYASCLRPTPSSSRRSDGWGCARRRGLGSSCSGWGWRRRSACWC